jgi:hypothetical protein
VSTLPITENTHSRSTITLRSDKRTRVVHALNVLRNERVKFAQFPRTRELGGPATWSSQDGDIVVCCPKCGVRSVVTLGATQEGDYRIQANGLLYPSFFCPQTFCTFDHYVMLVGWSGMGRLGRKRDNERGVILYCMIWAKLVLYKNQPVWAMQPPEYTHAVSQSAAQESWGPLLRKESGKLIGVAPAIDPHVSGDGDPNQSILALR